MKFLFYTLSLLLLAYPSFCAEDELAQHKQDFITFDKNQDDRVDPSEIRKVFPFISQEEISSFFIAADKNEDGLIDFDEYIHASLEHEDGKLDLDEFSFY